MRLALQVLQVVVVCAAAFLVAGALARVVFVDLLDLSVWFARLPAVAAGIAGYVTGLRGAQGRESWADLVASRGPRG